MVAAPSTHSSAASSAPPDHANCGRALYVDSLLGLAQGEDNAAIGLALGIGHSTVASHIKVIYQRLPYVSMGNKRAAAATWYLTVGRALGEAAG